MCVCVPFASCLNVDGCGSKPMGSHFGVGAPPILVYFSGWIGMFTGGMIWILTWPDGHSRWIRRRGSTCRLAAAGTAWITTVFGSALQLPTSCAVAICMVVSWFPAIPFAFWLFRVSWGFAISPTKRSSMFVTFRGSKNGRPMAHWCAPANSFLAARSSGMRRRASLGRRFCSARSNSGRSGATFGASFVSRILGVRLELV